MHNKFYYICYPQPEMLISLLLKYVKEALAITFKIQNK